MKIWDSVYIFPCNRCQNVFLTWPCLVLTCFNCLVQLLVHQGHIEDFVSHCRQDVIQHRLVVVLWRCRHRPLARLKVNYIFTCVWRRIRGFLSQNFHLPYFVIQPSYPPPWAPWGFSEWGTTSLLSGSIPAIFESAMNRDGLYCAIPEHLRCLWSSLGCHFLQTPYEVNCISNVGSSPWFYHISIYF